MVTLTWHACKYKVHKLHQRCIFSVLHVPLVEFIYLVMMVTLTWHACQYKVHKLHQRCILNALRVPLVEFMDLVFTRMPGESYRG